MKKTKTRNGSSRRLVAVLFGIAVLALVSVAPLAAGKKKEKPAGESVVAGTVFREPGYALPDAEVTLAATDESGAAKGKKLQFTTNTRGEFAFRFPSVTGRFLVSASARGYQKQQKTVDVVPSERVDVTFMLAPESK